MELEGRSKSIDESAIKNDYSSDFAHLWASQTPLHEEDPFNDHRCTQNKKAPRDSHTSLGRSGDKRSKIIAPFDQLFNQEEKARSATGKEACVLERFRMERTGAALGFSSPDMLCRR